MLAMTIVASARLRPMPRIMEVLVGLRSVGGVGPDVGRGVRRIDQALAQPGPVISGSVGCLLPADEAVPAVDADMRLVAEGRDRKVVPDRAVGLDLAGLEGPARVGVLLRRLGRLVGPDLGCLLAGLDRRILLLGVALPGCHHQAGIDDLSRHRQVAGVPDRPVQPLEQLVEGTRPDQRLAKVPKRVRIRHRVGDRQAAEPHPGEAVAHQMLGRLEAQPVLRLQIEHLELQHRVERRPTAFRPVAAAERLIEHRPEQLEVDDLEELLQRIALRRQLAKPILDAPEPRLPRQSASPRVGNPRLADRHTRGEVSGGIQLCRNDDLRRHVIAELARCRPAERIAGRLRREAGDGVSIGTGTGPRIGVE